MRTTVIRFCVLAIACVISTTAAQEPPSLPPGRQTGEPPVLPGQANIQQRIRKLIARPELVIDNGFAMSVIEDVAFSLDSKLIAVATGYVVRIVEADTGQVIHTIRGERSRGSYGVIESVAFSPDGRELLVGISDTGQNGAIRRYRTDGFTMLGLLAKEDKSTSRLCFDATGQYFASVGRDGEIRIRDWATKQVRCTIPRPDSNAPIVDDMMFSEVGKVLFVIGANGVELFNVPDGQRITNPANISTVLRNFVLELPSRTTWPVPKSKTPRLYSLQLQSGSWAASGAGKIGGSVKNWIGLWNTQDGRTDALTAKYTGHSNTVTAFSLSTNGRIAASGDRAGELHIWDQATGKLKHRLVGSGLKFYNGQLAAGSREIVYADTPDLEGWKHNQYGIASHKFRLKNRGIERLKPGAKVVARDEITNLSGRSVTTRRTNAASERIVEYSNNGQRYVHRPPSGQQISCFTLLPKPAIGIPQPILYGSGDGYLAAWNPDTNHLRRFFGGHDSQITSISASENSDRLLTASTDRTLRLWSLWQHQPTGDFDFEYQNQTVLRVEPNSSSSAAGIRPGDSIELFDGMPLDTVFLRMLYGDFNYRPGQVVPVVMNRNGTPIRYNLTLTSGYDYVDPLLNLFITEEDDWIIWTPQGYYDCSPGADRLIGWHVNQGPEKEAKFLKAQQFQQELYRPDIVDRIIDTMDVKEAVAIANLNRRGRSRPIDLRNPDQMAAVLPPVATPTPVHRDDAREARVSLEVSVKSQNALPITEVVILHNGTRAEVRRPRDPTAPTFNVRYRTKLREGRNTISFIASNSESRSTPEDCQFVLQYSGSKDRKPDLYVVSVGVNKCQFGNKYAELKFPQKDAAAVAALAKAHQNGHVYRNVHQRVITGKDASRAACLQAVIDLADQVEAIDVVLFFFSGHGDSNGGRPVLIAHDTNAGQLDGTGLTIRQLLNVMHDDVKCRRIIMLDACHSGGLVEEGQRNFANELANGQYGTLLFSSSELSQLSVEEDDWQHGALTYALLEATRDPGADILPHDGLLNATETGSAIEQRVSIMTESRQRPRIFIPRSAAGMSIFESLVGTSSARN